MANFFKFGALAPYVLHQTPTINKKERESDYIIQISNKMINHKTQLKFKNLKFKIQINSNLQSLTWSQIVPCTDIIDVAK